MASPPPDDDDGAGRPRGLTRREWFAGVGGGALAGSLLGPRARADKPGALPTPAVSEAPVLGPGPVRITFTLNGRPTVAHAAPHTSLLELLRDGLGLTGAKPACERGACGACTVVVDGMAVNACLMLALDAWGRSVTTVEGLAQGEALSPLQRAFVEHDALQCGFCTPGMLMSCHALLGSHPQPSADEVRRAIAGNLCRCGTYPKVLEAVLDAAGRKPGA